MDEKAHRILEWIKIPPVRIKRYAIVIYRENTPHSKYLYLYNHFTLRAVYGQFFQAFFSVLFVRLNFTFIAHLTCLHQMQPLYHTPFDRHLFP